MAKQPGRPKAVDPRDVKVSIRLTAREADVLQRFAKDGSLSAAVRKAIEHCIASLHGGAWRLPDTEQAQVQRALRHAKRLAALGPDPDAAALERLFALEAPAAVDPATPPADSPTSIRPQLILPPHDDSPVPDAVVTHPVTGKRGTIPLQRIDPFAHRR